MRKPVPKRKLSNWSNCKYVEAHPDVYLKEIAEEFGCHSFSVLNRLRKLCITWKKEHILQRAIPRPCRHIFGKNQRHSERKLVHIDETGLQTQLYRQYARSKRGKRVNIRISGKRYAWIGLITAHCEGKFVSPYIYNGTMKASMLEKWFEDEFLKNLSKTHVIIMDNASFHKKEILQNLAGKYSQTLIFFAVVFAGT